MKDAFRIKKGLNVAPTNPSSIVNPEPGDLIVDSTDNNRLKVFNTTSNSYEYPISSGGSGSGINPNHIINGNFDFWQRGTSLPSGTGNRKIADRFNENCSISTCAVSRQTLTQPSSNLFNAAYFHRASIASGNTSSSIAVTQHFIEDVTKLAGKTVTISFWAKADSNKNISLEMQQNFGTGGSPSAGVIGIGVQKFSISTSWQKITHTVTLPFINGKTLGTNGIQTTTTRLNIWYDAGSNFNAVTDSLGNQSGTFDIAQVKLEEGDVATPFVLAGGTIEGELAACQRYYEKSYNLNVNPGTNTLLGMSSIQISQNFINNSFVRFPFFSMVRKRVTPSFVIYSPTGTFGNLHIQGVDRLATPADVSEKGFVAFKNTSGVTWSDGNTLDFHWVADAEF
jgi:hypothetical protein